MLYLFFIYPLLSIFFKYTLYMVKQFVYIVLVCECFIGCENKNSKNVSNENLDEPGFKRDSSDAKAIQIADEVMHAMGGKTAWNNTRVIEWDFFGIRHHIWDKFTGDIRINAPSISILMNIHTMKGRVKKDSIELENPDSIAFYLQKGKHWWINDSYWLVMPFKLKDSGVTLKYLGIDTAFKNTYSHVLSLTFDNVGNTPHNKYKVYVDTVSHLVVQWAYYPNFDMDTPAFILPWGKYEKYGDILLSSFRGKNTRSPKSGEDMIMGNIKVTSEKDDRLYAF